MRNLLFLVLACLPFAHHSVAHASDETAVAQSALTHARQVDRFFWGELHRVEEQSAIIQRFLDLASIESAFDAVAVESILDAKNEAFNNYLEDASAVSGSSTEALHFKTMVTPGYTGTRTEANRNTYRALWKYKRRNPSTVFCGVDFNDAIGTTIEQRAEMWSRFPNPLRTAVLKTARLEESALLHSRSNYIREAAMANAAVQCTKGARRSLVILGAMHSTNPKYNPQTHWRDVTAYSKLLEPDKSILTLFNTITPETDDRIVDAISEYVREEKITAFQFRTRSALMQTPDRFALTVEDRKVPILFWDLFIFGPTGRKAELIY